MFHKYAVSRMCKAGIPVLDVYSMTASYPNGTLDHVHYNEEAQRAAEDQLIAFVSQEIKKKDGGIPNDLALKFKKLSFLVPERHIKYNFDTLFEIIFFFLIC